MTATIPHTLHQTFEQPRPFLNGRPNGEQVLDRDQSYTLPDSDVVRLNDLERDEATGEIIKYVAVVDPYFAELLKANPYAYEYALRDEHAIRAQMDQLEAMLRDDNSPEATSLGEAYIYDDSAAMRKWREGFPRAQALYNLRHPDRTYLPDGVTLIDNHAYERFAFSLDSQGIRTRGALTGELIVDYARQQALNGKSNLRLLSVASGAAVPVFEALQRIKSEVPSIHAHVTGIDKDTEALEFAHQIAPDYGLTEADFTTLDRNIVKALMYTDQFANELTEKPDVIDMLGIFEYFDKERAAILLAKSHQLLGNDGMLVFGNMLDTHPQLQVNQRAVGWPIIKPRSIAEIQDIIQMARDLGADIRPEDVSTFVPQDGVYAVVRIEKNRQNEGKSSLNGHHKGFGGRVIDMIRRSHNGVTKQDDHEIPMAA